jgi:ABC-type Fe3+/spermidine/putrescine transport system ATPase subunit
VAEVHLDGVRKAFGPVEVLHGISLTVASGEFVSLLGASGCGKTTLLRIVAGLEAPSAGRVLLGGHDVTGRPPERRDIAMMFQSYALLPHLTVAENVRFPLRMRGLGRRAEQRDRAAEALEAVRLTAFAERRPTQLSGGQQQRVALARAIVSRPAVLLLDEPLSNLDARLREDMQVELRELHERFGLTTLFVTHDQEEALSLSDRVVLLEGGRVEQEGTPEELYAAPATVRAARFLGSANILPAVVEDGTDGPVARLRGGQTLTLAAGEAARGTVALAIRQEDVELVPEGHGQLTARLETRIYLGARTRCVLDLDGVEVRVLGTGRIAPKSGQVVGLAVGAVTVLPDYDRR